jgi:hypothetical protein
MASFVVTVMPEFNHIRSLAGGTIWLRKQRSLSIMVSMS